MKFFTTQWWEGGDENAEVVAASYEAHFAAIRGQLPAALVELHEAHTLHDARLEHIACAFAESSIRMSLTGWNQSLTQPVRYQLLFRGVSRFEQSLPSGRGPDAELGELGYWECELVPQGIDVRLLFASSAELALSFEDFSFSCERVPMAAR